MTHSPERKKLALVFGGSRGIGAACVQALAESGFDVACTYVSSKPEAPARSYRADVGEPAQVAQAFADAARDFGSAVHCVVANAGIGVPPGPVAQFDPANFRRLVEVNVVGAFNVLREAGQRVADGGSIIAITTSMVRHAVPGFGPYAGSKAAVECMVRSMAKEIAPRKVRVNAVAPGPVDTELFRAGKSTLLKTLVGLVPPASGTIEYEGRDIAGIPAPEIARLGIGYVPQGRGLFAGMTVADNLALGRLARATDGSHGVAWSEQRILEHFPRLRERMNLAADYLSGGEQQMVAIARALSGNVKLLLLDEPFEGLAPTIVQELFTVFDRLRSQTSIVIVEHNLDLVLALADRVFALERGAVFHSGPAAPLLTDLDYRKRILWL